MKITGAALVLTALLVLAPGLASADSRKHSDAVGDVQYWVNTDPPNVPPPIFAGTRTPGDITGFRVGHSKTKVRVVISFRSLARAGQFHGHVFRFVSGTFERKAQITAGRDDAHGWKGTSEMFTPSDKPVTCRGMKHRIDYPHRQAILSVPRSCLRNPKSVRVGVGTVVLDNSRTYFDDGYANRGTMGGVALTPTLGPATAR